jgi:hypothetical protein
MFRFAFGLLFSAPTLVVVIIGAWFMEINTPRPRVNQQTFDKIRLGMTVADVAAIIGRPPGDHRFFRAEHPTGGLGPADSIGPVGEQVQQAFWYVDEFWIQVGLDSQGKVVAAYFGGRWSRHHEIVVILENICRFLGR